MTTRPSIPADMPDAAGDGAFDQTLRDHHSRAVERLSPQVRAQLSQRRNAALRGTAPARAGWQLRPLAAGLAMAGVLAIGLRLVPSAQAPAPAPAAGIATAAVQPVPATILDEDPEFYAWLASTDVQQLAME